MAIAQKQLPQIGVVQGPHDPELVDKLTALETLIETQTTLKAQLELLIEHCISSDDLAHKAAELRTMLKAASHSLDNLHRVRRKLLQAQGASRMRAV